MYISVGPVDFFVHDICDINIRIIMGVIVILIDS